VFLHDRGGRSAVDRAAGDPQQAGTLTASFKRNSRPCLIRNGDTPRNALQPGVLTTHSRRTAFPSAPTVMRKRCRTAPAPSAGTIKDAKSSTSKKRASLRHHA
jgi:hypothetical protein